jgi:hypothetical protein
MQHPIKKHRGKAHAMAQPKARQKARPREGPKARPKSRQLRTAENARRKFFSRSAKAAKQSNAIGQQAATLSQEVARIGAEVIELNTGAFQDAWRSGIELAADASQQSVHQFARMLQNGGAEQGSHFSALPKRIEQAMPRETWTRLPPGLFDLTEYFAAQQRSWLEQFGILKNSQNAMLSPADMMRSNMLRLVKNLRVVASLWENIARETAEQLGRTSDRIARTG